MATSGPLLRLQSPVVGQSEACSAIVSCLEPSTYTHHANSSGVRPRAFHPHCSISQNNKVYQRPRVLSSRSYNGDRNGRLPRDHSISRLSRCSRDCRRLSSYRFSVRSLCSASSADSLTETSVEDAERPFDEVTDGVRPSRRQTDNGQQNRNGSRKAWNEDGLDDRASPDSAVSAPFSRQLRSSVSDQGDVSVVADLPVDGAYDSVLTSLSAKYPQKLAPFSESYSVASENLQLLLHFADDSFAFTNKLLLAIFQRFPSFLATPLDPASVQNRLDLFLRYGVSRSEFFSLCSRANILHTPYEALAETLSYLRHGLGVVRVEKVLKCFPLVLNLSLPNLQEKVRQLKLAGLDPLNEVLERSPFVLSARASEIQRKVVLIKRILGSSSKVEDPIFYLRKFPQVLLAQYGTMERTYAGMVEYFGEEDTRKLLRRQPLLLGQNWEGMMDTNLKLIEVFGREHTLRIVNQTPTVMAYSWKTIEDKILFVTEVMGRSVAEIVTWPALLTRSLENRLRPRYELLRRLPREEQLGLGSMFGCTDEVFMKRYGHRLASAEAVGGDLSQEEGRVEVDAEAGSVGRSGGE